MSIWNSAKRICECGNTAYFGDQCEKCKQKSEIKPETPVTQLICSCTATHRDKCPIHRNTNRILDLELQQSVEIGMSCDTLWCGTCQKEAHFSFCHKTLMTIVYLCDECQHVFPECYGCPEECEKCGSPDGCYCGYDCDCDCSRR